jgi:PAS domain S-box-containing protein
MSTEPGRRPAAIHGAQASPSRDAFRLLLDHLPGAIYRCELHPPWRMEFMSPGISVITGFQVEEYLSGRFQRFADAIHPDDLGPIENTVEASIAQGRPYALEYRLSHISGGWRWVFERGGAVAGPDGSPAFLEGVFLDITARKRAEENMVAAITLSRDILDSLDSTVAVVDEHGTIVAVNRAWRQFAEANGASPRLRDGAGLSYLAALPDCDGRAVSFGESESYAGILEVIEGRQPGYRGEYACDSPSERRCFEVCATPLTGTRRGAVIAHTNITPRKRLEEALMQSEQRFRTLAETMSDFAYQVYLKPDGSMMREWHSGGRHSYLDSYTLDAEAGDHLAQVFEMIHPEDRPLFETRVERLRAGQPQVSEYRLLMPDGSLRYMRDYGRPLAGPDGRVESIIGALQDITDQRIAELERARLAEELVQAQKLESLGRLAGGVAHDFNNLLTVISGYAQLLLARIPVQDSAHNGLLQIHRAGERAAALIEQLLTFSRRKHIQAQPLDLGHAVAETHDMLARLVGEDIDVRLNIAPGPLTVLADPGQIQQVLLNLAANARDAMPTGGALTIAVRPCPPAGVELTVADTGVGMDRETQAHVFEPFFTTKQPGKGTGLGLATVHGIVVQFGGRIEVCSTLGQGTLFRIELPAADESPGAAASGDARSAAGGAGAILLVEDQAEVRLFAAKALRSFGYHVTDAASADEALAYLHSGASVDLLITDVVMPGLGGFDLARAARRERPALRIVFISGYWDDSGRLRREAEPGDVLLRKPFSLDQLADTVRQAIAAS